MQLTIDVPDDSPLATEVQSWADGGSYDLKVRQTSMGMFELLEAEASESDEAVADPHLTLPTLCIVYLLVVAGYLINTST